MSEILTGKAGKGDGSRAADRGRLGAPGSGNARGASGAGGAGRDGDRFGVDGRSAHRDHRLQAARRSSREGSVKFKVRREAPTRKNKRKTEGKVKFTDVKEVDTLSPEKEA